MIDNVNIESVLNENTICLHLKGKTKDEILKEMSTMLYEAGRISSVKDFLDDVYMREEEGITGIGNNVAIPHGKSDSVLQTSVAVGRSDEDIEWQSIDDNPVRLIIMLAIKSYDKTVHIRLLSKIATSLCGKEVIDELLSIEDKQEVIKLLSKEDQ